MTPPGAVVSYGQLRWLAARAALRATWERHRGTAIIWLATAVPDP